MSQRTGRMETRATDILHHVSQKALDDAADVVEEALEGYRLQRARGEAVMTPPGLRGDPEDWAETLEAGKALREAPADDLAVDLEAEE